MDALPTIAVLGAAGLIGQAIGEDLAGRGFRVAAIARRFTAAQATLFAPDAVTAPLVDQDVPALAGLLARSGAEVVVNCLGVLQDAPGVSTQEVHEGFAARLVEAIRSLSAPPLLIHLSMPGRNEDDHTAFARTKRAAERTIAGSGLAFVILRPGFVIAPAAFGGSALLRGLAMLPVGLPADVASRPFCGTAVADIAATIDVVARDWAAGRRDRHVTWEIGDRDPATVGDVVDALRARLGGPRPIVAVPALAMRLGALAGDLVARLGWAPPVRTTALAEMRRGVTLDPGPWSAATGLEPTSLRAAVARLPVTVQERWFARLFLVKPLVIVTLVAFWVLSGLIALTVAFGPASAILVAHGLPPRLADVATVVSSGIDISVGLAIAHRRSCGWGLVAGMVVALGYMGGAAVLTPDLWIEPLGALVKTGPAIVLMLVALLTLDAR